jgi:hypothetical protein
MPNAAMQHNPGTMPAQALPLLAPAAAAATLRAAAAARAAGPSRPPHLQQAPVIPLRVPRQPMIQPKPRQVIIQGQTKDGRTFRPSDWAERLAGAMSSFRPGGGAGGIGAFIGYSPFCVPNVHGGFKCVIVSEELRDIEPMAWDFVMNFARDNDLQVVDTSVTTVAKPEAGA